MLRSTRTSVIRSVVLVAIVAATTSWVAAGVATARLSAERSAQAQPTYTWPKIGHDPGNSGLSADPSTSATNASTLGVRWMVPTGAADLSSPVVAWNAALGETLVYQANEAGNITAFAANNGSVVWSDNLGSAIRDTPLVDPNGNVWVSPTYAPRLVKLNGATGVIDCSTPLVSTVLGSPTIGIGAGGAETVYMGVNDLGTASGPLYAVNDQTCATEWRFTDYNTPAGSWDALSYGTDANGENLVLAGTADTDESMYAIDAATGAKVWSFKSLPKGSEADIDIGGGADVSPPGNNGFADGVAYFGGKDGYEYALNLATGALIWDFNFFAASGVAETKSTPALTGNELIFGETGGAYALNATTGAVLWQWKNGGGESLSAPAIVGPPGSQVVALATLNGTFDVLSVATGQVLYSYQTGGFSTSSIAEYDGNFLASSSTGFLYDFSAGGGSGAGPSTAVTAPANGSTKAYPAGGTEKISGTASGNAIESVNVAIQAGGTDGMWWDATSGTWTSGYFDNPVAVATPGAASTTWTMSLPIPTSGAVYQVQASAVQANGLADITAESGAVVPSQSTFTVRHSPNVPYVSIAGGPWVAPGSTVVASGTGFADGETVQFTLNGMVLGSAVASASGAVPATDLVIQPGGPFGAADLVTTGETSSRTTSTPLEVSNSWTESGYNTEHTGSEPNDDIMAQHLSPVQNQFFRQAWSYPTGAALRTQPAISQDVAYFGNDAGTFSALDVKNSAPVWTVSEPSAIDSSAALDGHDVFFGTEAGSVVALAQTTGDQVWSTTTTSAVESPPAVAAGSVYVGSDNGTLYSLAEASGSVNWTATLGGAITGSPTVDTAAGLVIVGDASGDVTALSTTAGKVLWQHSTGAPVSSTVTIDNGDALVPSQSGTVYGFNEKTGTVIWSDNTGTKITANGALYYTRASSTPTKYAVGGVNGTVYYLSLSTGKPLTSVSIGGPIVGLSSAQGWVDASTSSGIVAGDKPGNVAWKFTAKAGYDSPPTVLNGVVYVTGLDQTIRAFTIPGRPIP